MTYHRELEYLVQELWKSWKERSPKCSLNSPLSRRTIQTTERRIWLLKNPPFKVSVSDLCEWFPYHTPGLMLLPRHMQANVHWQSHLQQKVYLRPPVEMSLLDGSVLKVIRPLYRVPNSGLESHLTYLTCLHHHIVRLEWNDQPWPYAYFISMDRKDCLDLSSYRWVALMELGHQNVWSQKWMRWSSSNTSQGLYWISLSSI